VLFPIYLVGIRGARIAIEGRELAFRATYEEMAPGEAAAVVGSTGLIEIAVRHGRAVDALGLRRGSPVSLR